MSGEWLFRGKKEAPLNKQAFVSWLPEIAAVGRKATSDPWLSRFSL